jgi:cytoskeletal protein CcmA (bactofilin family)
VHSAVSGEANFRGMLRVDGRVSGRINSQDGTLIVSAGGQVEANVEVAVAKINGTVNGDIKARERIEFGRTARVTGNIQTPALIIEQGAIFEGSCRMTEQPAKAVSPRPSAPARAAGNAPSTAPPKESKPAPAPVNSAVARPDVPAAREGAPV